MANNTVLNLGSGGDTLKTDDLGTVKVPASKIMLGGAGLDLGYVSSSNPFPVQNMSGSLAGLLVGGVALSSANPVPVTGSVVLARGATIGSGSLTGLLVGGLALSQANPLPTSGPEVGGLILSGSTFRTVQYAHGNYSSGSANQMIAPQGTNTRVRVLSVCVVAPGSAAVKFTSTGSVGTITDLSGLSVVPANGGFVLPYNPHGWFQTLTNEGLNIDINTAGGAVGVTFTWILAGA